MSRSWFTRSKNFSRSTSTTQPAVLDVPLRLPDCLVSAPSRSKAVAVLGERRIEDRLQDLQNRLLDEPVEHGRNPQLPGPAPTLGDLTPEHRLRLVAPRQQRLTA